MRLEIDDTGVTFWVGERIAGRYRYTDAFKPHLDQLATPAGHVLSLVSPHDHPHHKGLMYALRLPEVNFWEERVTLPGEVPGRQRHDDFSGATRTGEQVGFSEELTWLPHAGGEPVFLETRSLHCRALLGGQGYAWSWASEITAMRDLELTMSQWSAPAEDGRLVNYHGLGLRLRRDFSCTGGNAVRLDRHAASFAEAMGATPAECEFLGSIDGTWPIQRAGVRIRQEQENALFVLESPFAFLAMGPSNLAPRQMTRGERLLESYEITVFDLPPVSAGTA